MRTRALVKERAQRNLLLVIDGTKTEEMLLAHLAGISAADFVALQALGLITAVAPPAGGRSGSAPVSPPAPPPVAAPTVDVPVGDAPLDYGQFTAVLTQLISKELGLRGFVLTLAVEKAATTEELQAVAQRALAQIGERKGEAAAAAARRALYGL